MSLIYHYCSPDVFLSIIQNDCIWLGSVLTMNDSSETRYFREAVVPGLREALDRTNPYPRASDTFLMNLSSFEYYAACFASEPDDLYQWQAYGQGGRGFAIGFEPELLCASRPPKFTIEGIGEATAPIRSSLSAHTIGLSQVMYANKEKISDFAQRLIQEAEHHKDGGFDTVAGLAVTVAKFGAVIKSEHFRVEKEWRLLYSPTVSHKVDGLPNIIGHIQERKWRVSKYGLAPYFEYKGVRQAIRHIVAGPSCASKADGSYLLDFLTSHGLMGKVTITDSLATLR